MGIPDIFSNVQTSQAAAMALVSVPVLTRQAFAEAIGLPQGVLIAQCERGYWPQITIGKRVFINLEVLRSRCAAKEFS